MKTIYKLYHYPTTNTRYFLRKPIKKDRIEFLKDIDMWWDGVDEQNNLELGNIELDKIKVHD